MMGFSVIIIFALLQIRLLNVGGNPEDLSNIESADSSNHHQRHARQLFSSFSTVKVKGQNILETYLKLVESKDPPEDAVTISDDTNDYYILVTGKCNKVKLELLNSQAANDKEHQFLVNEGNYERLEWKTWADIESGKTPFKPLIICKSHYITIDKSGLPYLTDNKIKKNMNADILTLNNDIKSEQLQIDHYVVPEQKGSENIEVLKQFIALNRNCEPAKHVVKLDQGSDKTRSFLKGRGHMYGVGLEGSVSGEIPEIIKLDGKVSLKYDHSRSKSVTTSEVNKVLHSVSMEVQVPPNHSCTIEISSKTFRVQVPYSGWLIRQYKDNIERMISVNGIYDHQEVAELQTSVKPCAPLPDGAKCP